MFKNRRYFNISTLILSIALKFYLHRTTTLLLFITGFTIVTAGMAFRMYSASYLLGRHIVTKMEAAFLCTSGPFSYIRNPLYLGNFIIGTGLCITFNEWYGYAIFFIEYICMYSIIIPSEERFLQKKFSNSYVMYKKHTRRFLPGVNAYKGDTEIRPEYKIGILSEKHYVIILIITFMIFYLLFVNTSVR